MEDSDRRLRAGINRLLKETRLKECFFKNSDCYGKITKAHSIQNSKILSKIAEYGDLLVFKLSNDKWEFELNKIGRSKATTFTGFCNFHDTKIFNRIENHNYSLNDVEQQFLFSYRALAIAYNHKYSEMVFFRRILDLLEHKNYQALASYGITIQDNEHAKIFKKDYSVRLKFINIALRQREKNKKSFNQNLANRRFDSIETELITLPEEYLIASSSMLFVIKDFNGNIINNINIPKEVNKPLFLTIFPQDGRTYILMSYLKKQKSHFRFIKDILQSKNSEEQKILVSKLLIKDSDNFVLSPKTWNKLSIDQQNKINELLLSNKTEIYEDINIMQDVNLFI